MLGVMAFIQLLVAAMALASRFEQSRQVQVVGNALPPPLMVQVPAPSVPAPSVPVPGVSQSPRPLGELITQPPTELFVQPSPITAPPIANPRSERLVNEARVARVAGDMGKAIVKLEEARSQSPDDASVEYELGLVHEQMGVYDTAAAHYEKVFQMGVEGAGSLYEKAAVKLRDGFEQPAAMLGKLSLGRVRIFNPPNQENGQRVILTIPVQKGPADAIDVADIAVSVIFFNRSTKGEIMQLEDKSWVSEQWISMPFDWAGGEESLRMTYTIPPQDNPTEHLFGGRAYYGQVVSLLYKNEVLDVQAWPRDLAARIPRPPAAGQGDAPPPEFQDKLPPDFDPENPLLPALPEKH
ncbi:MAG: hypothetical protein RLZZ282_1175 [Verrucomicrobiota bacterium]